LLLHGIGGDAGAGGANAGSGDPAYKGAVVGRVPLPSVPSPVVGRVPPPGDSESNLPVITKDALAGKHGEYEIVLANPPFGKKSSVTIVNEAGESSKESLIIN